jgi:hypothetical protein
MLVETVMEDECEEGMEINKEEGVSEWLEHPNVQSDSDDEDSVAAVSSTGEVQDYQTVLPNFQPKFD